jgi:hypothetical protein
MAYEGQQPLKLSLEAGADLSAQQYRCVKMSADNKCIVCAAVTDKPIGILQNKPTSGQTAEVVCIGETKVDSDAALAAGNSIGSSADAQLAVYAQGTDTTKYIIGMVIQSSGAAGEKAVAVVNCPSAARGA